MSRESIELKLEKARSGDRRAFEELLTEVETPIQAIIRGQLGGYLQLRVEVADLLQETWVRAYRSISGFRGEDLKAFRSWLGSMAVHVVQDNARRFKVRRADQERPLHRDSNGGSGSMEGRGGDFLAKGETPSRIMRRDHRLLRLEQAIKELAPDQREVIYLARLQGLPVKEVASRLGKTPNAVSMLLFRAVRSLRTGFGNTDSLHLPKEGFTSHDPT